MIKTEAIAERRVVWTPKGYGSGAAMQVIIRDGKTYHTLAIEDYYLNSDIDGVIEFLKQVKRAMAETIK